LNTAVNEEASALSPNRFRPLSSESV